MDHVTTAVAILAVTFATVTIAVAVATLWVSRTAPVDEASAG